MACAASAGMWTQKRAINEATMATNTTRKYCMKATSGASAPKASAMSIITGAAPGNSPQTAVVPCIMRSLLISHPSAALATTVVATTARNSGQSSMNLTAISDVNERAIRQPIIA
jgi:hypothetical protein